MRGHLLNPQSVLVDSQGDREAIVRGYSEIRPYHWQQQGIASKAPRGSRALVMRLGGDSSNAASFFAHDNTPPPVELGDTEVVVFAGADAYLHIQPNGTIRVHGDIRVSGDVITDKGVSLNEHTHPQNSGNHFGGGTNTSPPNA